MKSTSKGKSKKRIKSFIYLDEYKMYSISSQIFEGLTEYVTNYSGNKRDELEAQEGPVGSGRVLADILNKEASTEERKFLHDYSYSLFEEKLFDDKRVLQIDSSNIGRKIKNLDDYDFIKIRGRILFNDVKIVNETIKNINQLGMACAYLATYSHLEELRNQFSDALVQSKNKNEKGFAKQSSKKINDLSIIAKNLGWNIDQEFLDNLGVVLNYGYKDQFEVRTYLSSEPEGNYLFSALLKKEYLREEENLIVNKYSRYSEKDFIIFGTVTQSKDGQPDLPAEESSGSGDMKEAVAQMILKLSEMEKQFTGKLKNEIMVDPIAIYREF
jgi:hypothetical protein